MPNNQVKLNISTQHPNFSSSPDTMYLREVYGFGILTGAKTITIALTHVATSAFRWRTTYTHPGCSGSPALLLPNADPSQRAP